MIAYKTYSQAPSCPQGVPLEYPWIKEACSNSQEQIDAFIALGYTVVEDQQYETYLASFQEDIDAYNLSLSAKKAKILRYVYEAHKHDDVRSIDHNIMLNTTLKISEVIGAEVNNRGLLLEKHYLTNENELIFKIIYTYEKNEFGQYTGQGLNLRWFAEDGTIAAEKDKGLEPLSTKRSKEIVKNRRRSIANMLENNVEGLLLASGAGNAGLALGRAMLSEIAPHTQTFIESGVSAGIVNYVSDPAKHAIYPFLLAEVAPGVSVVAYIIDFLDFN